MPPHIEMTLPLDQHEIIEQSLPHENQDVIKRRKYLLILVLVQWIVFVIILGVAIYSILSGNAANTSNGFQFLIPIIVFIFYYTYGLLITYRAHRIGLLIFASIGIILFIALCLFLCYISLVVVALSGGLVDTTDGLYGFFLFIGLVFAVTATVAIATIRLSFDLAKLIRLNEQSVI